ncbi:sensor histidine kinase [Rossellomorea aquimaris]|uniref:sensor histidine kinase n=1 Tax=Rossellomorea aquimaris TaxID=189382 RepID=UPI001CD370B9|nr:sensor histidine kinase [Rossellomorea aquimaris]MCA1057054.1 sensor histidine kinase [Rossellomorea aquimaris]
MVNEAFIRTLFLSILWGTYIYIASIDAHAVIILFILCAISFALFFIAPVTGKPVFIYMCQPLLLFMTTYFVSAPSLSWMIIGYFLFDASIHLHPSGFRLFLYSVMTVLVAEALLYWGYDVMAALPFMLMLMVLTLKFNELIADREGQRHLYDQLLGEYRKLKRVLYVTERHSKAEERTRIARDIHDSVGHKLTALMMKIEILSIQHGRHLFEELKELAADSLEDTREAVKALKEGEVEGIQSVIQLIRKLESESGIMVELTTQHGVLSTRLSNKQAIAVYRSIQEGITNAMKHSSIREVKVMLGKTALGHFQFVITNKIDQDRQFQLGFGLTNMKERIEELGGRLEVHQTDKEFILRGAFPVKEGITA